VVKTADRGIFFSLAAGNESDSAEEFEPAHVEHENVYTISAIDRFDVFASFSNYGNPPVDYAAPGVSILSTRMGGGVTTMSGTSMAAPHVCGILLSKGSPATDGDAVNDPDGNPDPIAHF
jgi:subtilisin family serine protease